MNLGQLIGELRARAEAAEAGEGNVASMPPPAKPRGKRQHQLMQVLEDGRTVGIEAVVSSIGISAAHAGVLLHTMATKGLISRHGRLHAYRYTKLGVAPSP